MNGNTNLSGSSINHIRLDMMDNDVEPTGNTAKLSKNPDFNNSSTHSLSNPHLRVPQEISISRESSMREDVAYEDDNAVTLIFSKHERLSLRDFQREVRGIMDIQKMENDMVLILDLNKSTIDEIVDASLHKMLDTTEGDRSFVRARSVLFTHDQVHQMGCTVQGTSISTGGGVDYDQSWICILGTLPSIQDRHVCFIRLRHPANFGVTAQEVSFVVVILAPTKEKGTKTAREMARTLATLLSDPDFRRRLLTAPDEISFRAVMWSHTKCLTENKSSISTYKNVNSDHLRRDKVCRIGSSLSEDLRNRLPHYFSDFTDGIYGQNTIYKTISTALFLYFACLLPSIAFGVLNDKNTKGNLTVRKVIMSQTFGGLVFSFVGGCPLIVLLTTAPLALYTLIIYTLAEENSWNFLAFYACVGLWNSFFLTIYSLFGLSMLMKWSTRSSEEIFAVFISIAFTIDAIKNCLSNFKDNYFSEACLNATSTGDALPGCDRSVSLLYLILMLGTLWISVTLYNFTKTPYLTAGKREILADYALPVSVIIMAFFGSYVWKDVKTVSFNATVANDLVVVPFESLNYSTIFVAMGLGFCLSLLFFMDQNISAALVNNPRNKLKKGTTYHWDLLVIAFINAVLSIFGLPWVHAALPHSPLHVAAMADVEERVDQGAVHKIIVYVRETRLTTILSNVLIGLSLLFIAPVGKVLPSAVLYGLFLYIAVTALNDNQLFERIMLLFTEQSAYPPNHYIRRVPQRKIHYFTLLQLLQLGMLCFVGFFNVPYVKMFFPILLFLLIPIRHKIIPRFIHHKYLSALDSDHH